MAFFGYGFIFWLFEAVLVAHLAHERGRSRLNAFVAALVAGPLALVVVLGLPVKPWALPVKVCESKYCRFCRSRISVKATACPCCSQPDP